MRSIVLSVLLFTSCFDARANELTAAVAEAAQVLINPVTVEAPKCNTFVNYSKCPTWMKNQLVENRGDRWRDILARNVGGMITANEGCNIAKEGLGFNATEFKEPEVLEHYLANSRAGLSSPPNFLNKCMMEQGLNSAYGPDERKALVSEFYYKMNRLRQGSHGALEAIANYDGLLGEESNFWNSDECKSEELTTATFCNEQAKCPVNHIAAQDQHRKTSQELADLMPHYLQAEEALKNAENSRCNGRRADPQACIDARNAKIKKFQTVLNLFQDRFPYLQSGSVFRKEFAKMQKGAGRNAPNIRYGHISTALKDQYRHDRDSTMKEWQKAHNAAKCLQGTAGRKVDCDDIEETVDKMPEYRPDFYKSETVYPPTPEGKALKKLHFSANYEIGSGQCVRAIRGNFQTGRSLINNFAGDVAVTIGTAGAGAYLAAARTAATSARLAQAGGEAATRFGKVAQLLKTPKGKLYAGLLGTVGAGELYFASHDFRFLADSCFGGDQNNIDVGPATESPTCQLSRPDSSSRVAQSQVGGCLLAAGLASLNFLPVAGPALARLNNMRAPPAATRAVVDVPNPAPRVQSMADDVTRARTTALPPPSGPKVAHQLDERYVFELDFAAIGNGRPAKEISDAKLAGKPGELSMSLDLTDERMIQLFRKKNGVDQMTFDTTALHQQMPPGYSIKDVTYEQVGSELFVKISFNPPPVRQGADGAINVTGTVRNADEPLALPAPRETLALPDSPTALARTDVPPTTLARIDSSASTDLIVLPGNTTALARTDVPTTTLARIDISANTDLVVRNNTPTGLVTTSSTPTSMVVRESADSAAGLVVRRADVTPTPTVARRLDDTNPSGVARRVADIGRRADSVVVAAIQNNTPAATPADTPSTNCSLELTLTTPQPTLAAGEFEFEFKRSVTEGEIGTVIDAKRSSGNKIISSINKDVSVVLSNGVVCKGKTPGVDLTHLCTLSLTADPSNADLFSASASITPALTPEFTIKWLGGAIEGDATRPEIKFKRTSANELKLYVEKGRDIHAHCIIAIPGAPTPAVTTISEAKKVESQPAVAPIPVSTGADGKLPPVMNFGSEESHHLFKQGIR